MNKTEPIIVEQTFNAPVAKVWSAITDEDQMRQWFFETMDSFKPEVGFATQFNVKNGDNNYLHIWKVIEVIPEKKITYNWKYGGYAGDSFLTWELSSENTLTRLKLTHAGQETFQYDNPDFLRESCIKGWNFFIHKRLKEFLELDK